MGGAVVAGPCGKGVLVMSEQLMAWPDDNPEIDHHESDNPMPPSAARAPFLLPFNGIIDLVTGEIILTKNSASSNILCP